MDNLNSRYFHWLVSIANLPEYTRLLKELYLTPFKWTIPFDANRADDGVQLRYRFGRIYNIPDAQICAELDGTQCSMLEMMVALGIRTEEDIMSDAEFGDRVSFWIHVMISSLGLSSFNDHCFDALQVNYILERFLNHGYTKDGSGGLFYIPDLDPSRDMRTVEIWYQLNWYLNYITRNGG